MTNIYPPFHDAVDFYVVGYNESLSELADYQSQSGHPGILALPIGNMLRDFRVTSQSTKVAIDANGIITYRAGYGQGNPSGWPDVLQALADSAQQPSAQ